MFHFTQKLFFNLPRLLASTLIFIAVGSHFAVAQSASDQVAAEDDWSLPSYVKRTEASGIYGGYGAPYQIKDVEDFMLIWKKINPRRVSTTGAN
jgi:hypothetical protein